ncbi:hypothetical protein FSHL1_000166 [Fusarium sambucinum]
MYSSLVTLCSALLMANAAKGTPVKCQPGRWVTLSSLPSPRQEHGTVAINDNTIAILGGIVPAGQYTEVTDLFQLYDIPSDTWKTASPAPYKINHPNVAAVNNKLYLLGGLVNGPTIPGVTLNWIASGSSYVYDVATDKWTEVSAMPNGTERGSAIVGGTYQDAVSTVTAFNTTSGEWQRLVGEAAELPESRQHGTGGVIDNTFFVIGGRWFGQLNTRDTVFELDLANLDAGWKTSQGRTPTARGGLNGGAIGDKFYAFGGEGNPDTASGVFNQSEVFNTKSQHWSELKPMAVPRHGTQAAAAGNRIYIPGGGLQQDGKSVTINGTTTFQNPSAHFDAYCA